MVGDDDEDGMAEPVVLPCAPEEVADGPVGVAAGALARAVVRVGGTEREMASSPRTVRVPVAYMRRKANASFANASICGV